MCTHGDKDVNTQDNIELHTTVSRYIIAKKDLISLE